MMTSGLALLHGLPLDWRYEAPLLADSLELPIPDKPSPYPYEYMRDNAWIANRELLWGGKNGTGDPASSIG